MTAGECADHRFADGLRVIVHQTASNGVAVVRVSAGVGYRDDPVGSAGAAHLLEHLAFEPLQDGVGHIEFVERLGGSTGAQTFEDTTEFFSVVPTRHLEATLRREFLRLAELPASPGAVGRAGAVVVSELRSTLPLRPHRYFPWTVLPEHMYADFPHGHNGYGDEDAVRALTTESLGDLRRAGYGARGLVVVVCADLPTDEVLELIGSARSVPDHGGAPVRQAPRPAAVDLGAEIPPGSVAAIGFESSAAGPDWEDRRAVSGLLNRALAESGTGLGDGLRLRRCRYSYFDSPPTSGPDVFWLTADVTAPMEVGVFAERCRALVERGAEQLGPDLVGREDTGYRTARALAQSDPSEAARTLVVRARIGAEPTLSPRELVTAEFARSELAELSRAHAGVTWMGVAS